MLEKWFKVEAGCFVCGAATKEFLCLRCAEQLSFYQKMRGAASYRNHRLFFATPYFSSYRALIARLKFGRDPSLAKGMAYLMCSAYLAFRPELPDVLAPMPAGPLKEKQRGFGQSRLLAEELSRLLGIPVRNLLSRKDAKALALSAGSEREGRIGGSMKLAGRGTGKAERILVIDDIHTTGATMREAARVLREGGYAQADFLFFSRQEMFENLKKWFPGKTM